MTTLKLNIQSNYPLEAEVISPDHFLGKSEAEIASLPVCYGNETHPLGDFFTVTGDGSNEIILEGDLSRVKYVGAGMTGGKITSYGSVGMHLGSRMSGGEITVNGDAGDWAGAEMVGGKMHIKGNAGHGLGGAYRGSRHGMNRGLILVDGNTGNETGALMRRGLIAVQGNVGDFAGAFMLAGTLVVFGHLGARAGAGLKYGTLVAYHPPQLLPTFHFDCVYQPGFLRLILKNLRMKGLEIADELFTGNYRRYSGDFNTLGKGEILVYDQH
jgi:formylmethanofuran dehydrogenase subunit C